MAQDRYYNCRVEEGATLSVGEVFYEIKEYSFISLYLGYNDKYKSDLYMYAWRWKNDTKVITIDWTECTLNYFDIYIEDWAGNVIEKWNEWGEDKLEKLIDKYYTE